MTQQPSGPLWEAQPLWDLVVTGLLESAGAREEG